jgi:hypothetical protein
MSVVHAIPYSQWHWRSDTATVSDNLEQLHWPCMRWQCRAQTNWEQANQTHLIRLWRTSYTSRSVFLSVHQDVHAQLCMEPARAASAQRFIVGKSVVCMAGQSSHSHKAADHLLLSARSSTPQTPFSSSGVAQGALTVSRTGASTGLHAAAADESMAAGGTVRLRCPAGSAGAQLCT